LIKSQKMVNEGKLFWKFLVAHFLQMEVQPDYAWQDNA
ncbi:unnamed protein product, partial [marine sediment metagenome]